MCSPEVYEYILRLHFEFTLHRLTKALLFTGVFGGAASRSYLLPGHLGICHLIVHFKRRVRNILAFKACLFPPCSPRQFTKDFPLKDQPLHYFLKCEIATPPLSTEIIAVLPSMPSTFNLGSCPAIFFRRWMDRNSCKILDREKFSLPVSATCP